MNDKNKHQDNENATEIGDEALDTVTAGKGSENFENPIISFENPIISKNKGTDRNK